MARTKLQFYFLATGFVFLALFSGLVLRTLTHEDDRPTRETSNFLVRTSWTVFRVSSMVTTLFLAAVCFHISSIRASKYHTLPSILLFYIMNQMLRLFSGSVLRKFDASAKDPRRAQEEFLISRMQRDANTAYGKRHRFSNIKSLEDLRNSHPLTSYDHYEEYLQRMADGEKNVLICEDMVRFGITSGTTGKGKLIPIPKSRNSTQVNPIQILWQAAIRRKYGIPSPLQKDIILYVNPRPTKTPGGDVVGPMHLYTDDMKFIITQMVSVPWEAVSISTEHEAHYLTLLFGLRDPDIGRWMGPFSSQIHKAMSKVENHWEQFVHDIKTGTVDKDLKISTEVREACEKALLPEPERAEELRREFEKGFDGIMGRVWPHMKYIFGINTADFTQKLEEKYAKGVPIVAPAYSSTEGDYGINLWYDEDKYALLPSLCIYEFIPVKNIDEADPKTLLLDEVKKGETYEMFVSPLCGFYRYRFGDVIKVVDFYYNLPVIKFMYRSGQLLNLRAEKVTELSVDEAVQHMVNSITETKITNWISAENTLLSGMSEDLVEYEEGSQFYLIFVELEGEGNGSIALDKKHQQQFDEALQERNNYYKGYRNAGTISPPRVYLVKPGTFKALQDYIIANSTASYNQFKMPRKLKTAGTLKLMLDSRVV
ncbi:uncharacterized protein [Amphiura filiformis]|uniref:uncharacterized protein isoform X2 n=1 Tax=Amphiura filiformis TaxID=82378 RepID=UPI003B21AF1E